MIAFIALTRPFVTSFSCEDFWDSGAKKETLTQMKEAADGVGESAESVSINATPRHIYNLRPTLLFITKLLVSSIATCRVRVLGLCLLAIGSR